MLLYRAEHMTGGMHIGAGPSSLTVEALNAELAEKNTAVNRTIFTIAFFMVVFSPESGHRLRHSLAGALALPTR